MDLTLELDSCLKLLYDAKLTANILPRYNEALPQYHQTYAAPSTTQTMSQTLPHIQPAQTISHNLAQPPQTISHNLSQIHHDSPENISQDLSRHRLTPSTTISHHALSAVSHNQALSPQSISRSLSTTFHQPVQTMSHNLSQIHSPQVQSPQIHTQVHSPHPPQIQSPQLHTQIHSPQIIQSSQIHSQIHSPQMIQSPQIHSQAQSPQIIHPPQIQSPQIHPLQIQSPQIHPPQILSPHPPQILSPQIHPPQIQSPQNLSLNTSQADHYTSLQPTSYGLFMSNENSMVVGQSTYDTNASVNLVNNLMLKIQTLEAKLTSVFYQVKHQTIDEELRSKLVEEEILNKQLVDQLKEKDRQIDELKYKLESELNMRNIASDGKSIVDKHNENVEIERRYNPEPNIITNQQLIEFHDHQTPQELCQNFLLRLKPLLESHDMKLNTETKPDNKSDSVQTENMSPLTSQASQSSPNWSEFFNACTSFLATGTVKQASTSDASTNLNPRTVDLTDLSPDIKRGQNDSDAPQDDSESDDATVDGEDDADFTALTTEDKGSPNRDKPEKQTCTVCNRVFSDTKGFQHHNKVYKGECGYLKLENTPRKKHERISIERLTCPTCQKVFADPRGVINHKRVYEGRCVELISPDGRKRRGAKKDVILKGEVRTDLVKILSFEANVKAGDEENVDSESRTGDDVGSGDGDDIGKLGKIGKRKHGGEIVDDKSGIAKLAGDDTLVTSEMGLQSGRNNSDHDVSVKQSKQGNDESDDGTGKKRKQRKSSVKGKKGKQKKDVDQKNKTAESEENSEFYLSSDTDIYDSDMEIKSAKIQQTEADKEAKKAAKKAIKLVKRTCLSCNKIFADPRGLLYHRKVYEGRCLVKDLKVETSNDVKRSDRNLSRRTCKSCNQVFADPRGVIHHKNVYNGRCSEYVIKPRRRRKKGDIEKKIQKEINAIKSENDPNSTVIDDAITNKIIEDILVSDMDDESEFFRGDVPKRLKSVNKKSELAITLQCHVCGKIVPKRRMYPHLASHSVRYSCDICGKKYFWQCELNAHRLRHTRERDYLCRDCGRIFKCPNSLLSHRKNIHINDRKHVCSKCGRSFNEGHQLRKHDKVVHQNYRPFVCDVCGHASSTDYNLRLHKKVHQKNLPVIQSVQSVQCVQTIPVRDY